MSDTALSQGCPDTGPEKSSSPYSPEMREEIKQIAKHCEEYKTAEHSKAIFQLLNTFVPFFIICAIMLASFESAYWLTALLTIPAAGLLVRIFIIQHDCGHGSFTNARKWNNRIGRVCSLLTWTPYDFWRKTHNMHHADSGNLEKRGYGAIETVTVAEYEAMSPRMRFWYRIYRNPVVMLVFGTPIFIIAGQRFAIAEPFPFVEVSKSLERRHIWRSVYGTNISLLLLYGGLGLVFGFGPVLLTYLPIVVMTAWGGGWLFYIQHQFEDTYWQHQENWSYHEAAVLSSSYYDLPKVLQWFTGNIGLHHIHHLSAKIPNYRLQDCMDAYPVLKDINRITFLESLKCTRLALWDEGKNKLVGFPAG